jgi:hypothetical protein
MQVIGASPKKRTLSRARRRRFVPRTVIPSLQRWPSDAIDDDPIVNSRPDTRRATAHNSVRSSQVLTLLPARSGVNLDLSQMHDRTNVSRLRSSPIAKASRARGPKRLRVLSKSWCGDCGDCTEARVLCVKSWTTSWTPEDLIRANVVSGVTSRKPFYLYATLRRQRSR